jgi:hypothetical protein
MRSGRTLETGGKDSRSLAWCSLDPTYYRRQHELSEPAQSRGAPFIGIEGKDASDRGLVTHFSGVFTDCR